jgi:uncharacterized HAD superfamily protein
MYKEQKQFQDAIMQSYGIGDADKEKFLKDLLIHLNAETFEVLDEINWKMHRRQLKSVDEQKLLHEMVDVLKYAISLPASWGFTAEQVEKVFSEKGNVVLQRFKQEMINKDFSEHDKVVGVDIDGVLLTYPEDFVEFVCQKLKINRKKQESFVMKRYALYDDLAKHLHVSAAELRKLKHEFRSNGHKRKMRAYPDGVAFVRLLRSSGYKVVLLSARPVNEYPSLFYDTIASLAANEIPYDGIYFSENKEEEILKRFPNIQFFVEDCLENAEKITAAGKKVYLVDRTYNRSSKSNKKMHRVSDLRDIRI